MPPTQERSGNFADQDFLPLIRQLAEEGFSGSVRADRDGMIKVLYLADGALACSSSTDPQDRLGPILRKDGFLTSEQLDMAEEKALAGEALGSVLVNLGFIGPRDLMRGARRQVERVVASLLSWPSGEYRARPGPLPDRAVNLKLALPGVLLGASRCLDSREDVLAHLGSLDTVLEPAPGPWPDELALEVRDVWELVDGRRDLRTVCAEAPLDDFEAAKVVLGLFIVGLLRPVATLPAESTPEESDELAQLHEDDLEEDRPATSASAPPPPALSAQSPDAMGSAVSIGALGGAPPPEDDADVAAALSAISSIDDELPAPTPDDDIASTQTMPQPISVAEALADAGAPGDERPGDDLPFETPSEEGEEGMTGEISGETSGESVREPAGATAEADDDLWDIETGEDTPAGPPPEEGGSGGRRTWMIGGAMVILAAASFYVLLGNRGDAPPLETTAPETSAGPSAVETPDAGPVADPTPTAPDSGSASPTSTGPAAAVSSPPTPDPGASGAPTAALESPPPDARLMGGEGYGAGLAAFRKGDFSRAAEFWRQDLQAAPKGAYTLQLLAACDPRTLERIGRRVPTDGSLRLAPAVLSGRPCYRVLWGIYADRERAVAAGAGVPAYFTEPPVPVPVARIAP